MLEQLPNGDMKDAESGNLAPGAASVKFGGAGNEAYAGVPQSDDPKVLEEGGDHKVDEEVRSKMACYLCGVWQKAVDDKHTNGIDLDLLSCLNQFDSKYEISEAQELDARGFPKVYFPLSEHKVHTAIAWIDEFFTNGKSLINIRPTPSPETENDVVALTVRKVLADILAQVQQTGQMPPPAMVEKYASMVRSLIEPQVEDAARSRALKMEKQIQDDLVEGKWGERMHDLIGLACVYGTAGFRSPVIKLKERMVWDNGKVSTKTRVYRTFEAVSPFDMFPAAGCTDTQHGDLCVRVRYNPIELAKMREAPGWSKDAIEEILTCYGQTGLHLPVAADDERRRLTKQNSSNYAINTIEAFEYWGSVSGEMLREIGITKYGRKDHEKDIADTAYDWYPANAVVAGGKVLYCRVMEEWESRPIDAVKFYDVPNSFWGRGVLQKIRSLQKICNAAGRSLVTNMGYASGPQGIVDLNMLAPGDDLKIRPWKIWQVRRNATNLGNGKPVEFFSIDSHAKEMVEVFDYFQREADELTGIPAYANGTDAATGAARTATGLNLLMGQANRGIKKVIGNFDELTGKAMEHLYQWHMMYNPDDSIKGDITIEVLGLRYFVTKTSRANDILNLVNVITQNPALAQIPGAERLCRLLQEVGIAMDLGANSLAPGSEELARRQEEARQAAMQQQAQAQAAAEQEQRRQMEMERAKRPQEITGGQAPEGEVEVGLTPTGRPQYAPRPPQGGEA